MERHQPLGNPLNQHSTNKINRNTHKLWFVPIVTVWKYFQNAENVYFLILSLLQLSTLKFLPRSWSPTGPFSTSVPLLLCVALEVLIALWGWYQTYKSDKQENNRIYFNVANQSEIKSSDIKSGHVLVLKANDVVPADCFVLSAPGHICKASFLLLNGETNLKYIHSYELDWKTTSVGCELKNLHNNNIDYHLTAKNILPKGAIVKSDNVIVLVMISEVIFAVKPTNTPVRQSRLDNIIGSHMTKTSFKILITFILAASTVKTFLMREPSKVFFYIVQHWILFNGVVPFSVKMFMISFRNLESKLKIKPTVKINSSGQVDDLMKIQHIVSDKTGTLTKGELTLDKIAFRLDSGSFIASVSDANYILPSNIVEVLAMSINKKDVCATAEDEILDQFATSVQYSTKAKIIETGDLFDFDHKRRMSSVVYDNNGSVVMYTKGSVETICRVLIESDQSKLRLLENLMNRTYPELRLMAFAQKILSDEEIAKLADPDSKPEFFEKDLLFSCLIGIVDVLQDGTADTVEILQTQGIKLSICTGDRKITALAIASKLNLIKNRDYFEHDFNNPNFPKVDGRTVIINGDDLSPHANVIRQILPKANNFIGYNMKPENKMQLTSFLEESGIQTMTIGDGYNDLEMFAKSTMSVAIKSKMVQPFVENSADYVCHQFRDLKNLFEFSMDCFETNSKVIEATFYRSTLVVSTIISLYLLDMYDDLTTRVIFSGFVIQFFNNLWTMWGLIRIALRHRKINIGNLAKLKDLEILSTSIKSYNIAGLTIGLILGSVSWFFDLEAHVVALTILACNIGMIENSDYWSHVLPMVGPIVYYAITSAINI
jgi:magnesium-transporting ATPase (P-type)